MGAFTPFANLYKPEGNELVDEDSAINDNSDKIDVLLEDHETRIAAAESGFDTRLDVLEDDTNWISLGGGGNPMGSVAATVVNVDTRLRRLGDVVHFHFNATWNSGNVLPAAGGNIADVQVGTIYANNLPDPITSVMVFIGIVGGGGKYIGVFTINCDTGDINLIQVDSNAEGNIVNGDTVAFDATWLAGPI